ncbi:hypothetical protein QBC34DRAFT_444161 [Podospora aff. communis PSN243]|uniref:DUF3669 domain-containing protein n=1 Tax=Podospora aff. communis PSN243 TaxID=3040156 RepID=A0AAV9FY25_9PEZI|nr:hypothetical protein QBC34DRAFT_444161 [Podospora aff. communis PSN243]
MDSESSTDATSAREILHHLLSLRNPESPVLPAHKNDIPPWNPTAFRKIGFGQCGLVFTVPNQLNRVIKVARPFFNSALETDHAAHARLAAIIANRPPSPNPLRVTLPPVYAFHTPTSPFWTPQTKSCFPPAVASTGFPLPSAGLITGYIPPLPLAAREAIIALYCPEEKQEAVRKEEANADCLVRVYLGRKRKGDAPRPANFGLRNYNLCLDQMVELALPVGGYAVAMGEALAEMHFGAGMDAFDVEFVFGGRGGGLGLGDGDGGRDGGVREEGGLNGAEMWVLDFNLCSVWEWEVVVREGLEGEMVEQMVHAFFGNDPYYPRPKEEGIEGEMWRVFGEGYKRRAEELIGAMGLKCEKVPGMFLRGCEKRQEELPEGVDKVSTDPV